MEQKTPLTQERLNQILKEIRGEAQELEIPVPAAIAEEVRINDRPKKRFGCCRRQENHYQIEVSRFLLSCGEKNIRNVIAHELLHTCRGCYDHGAKWKEYAERMNRKYGYQIKRTSSFAEMGIAENEKAPEVRYIIKCQQCGREYPRQRFTCVMKKIDAYRCSCGGKLTVFQKKQ